MRNTTGLKRGGPGRKPGVPNKTTLEIKERLAQLFDDAYFTRLCERAKKGKLAPAVECKLLAYRYGEPKQTVDVPQLGDLSALLAKKLVFHLHPGPTKSA